MKIIIILLCLSFVTPAFGKILPDVIEDVLPSVVQLEAKPKMLTSIIDKVFDDNAIRSGTAFFIEKDLLLTSYHIVKDSEAIYISKYGEDEILHKVDVVGYDKFLDIAVLKIVNVTGKPVTWATCTLIRTGEDVFVIGNPFGYRYSVSKGIISHKDRRDPRFSFVRYLQSDVAVNKGNSGGPMFNMNGEAIGIVQAIISVSGGSNGMALAVESDLILNSIARMKDTPGEVKRASLGIGVEKYDVTYKEFYKHDYGNESGLIIRNVIEGSAAEKYGIKSGDLLLSINDEKFITVHQMIDFLQTFRPDDTITVIVKRDKTTLTLTVTLGAIKD